MARATFVFSWRLAPLLAAATLAFGVSGCGNEPTDTGSHSPRPATQIKEYGANDTEGSDDRVASRSEYAGNLRQTSARSRRSAERALLRMGDEGPIVADLHRRLTGLGYWAGPPSDVFGPLIEQAVLAFQGVAGLERDGVVGPKTRLALEDASPPRPRTRKGDAIEIDEKRGVVLVINEGHLTWVFHTSTGTDQPYRHRNGRVYSANTPDGRWKIMYEYSDGWHKAPLGRLWRPKYFHRSGIAIHGFASVPPYPASHGCARVSIEAMNLIWKERLAPMGSAVWVY
jgi:Putative peptidoglycan binding domain/L,D-transpeptidase catalytic domain